MEHSKKVIKTVLSLSLALSFNLLFLGCEESSSSTTPTTTSLDTTTLTGMVADGYLVGAKVCLDKNYNDACDADESFVLTDSTGRYTFTLLNMAATELPLIVEADASTIDLDDNQAIGQKWYFKSVSGGENFISPLTTLIAREMDLNVSLTLAEAMIKLQTDLGLDSNVSTDYIVLSDTKAHNTAKIIAHSLANTEANLSVASNTTEPRMVRLLAAQQIRSQTGAIQIAADANDTAFLCEVNATNVDTQIAELNTLISSSLSGQLQDDLLFMWEEEKLARDVYLTLYEKWGAKVFINIANNGEQTHIDSVKSMIDKYQILTVDYADYSARGIFLNTNLQALYDMLVVQGNVSLIEAYKVGILIENTDIEDLDSRLLPIDLPADIRAVYENLRKGSMSHLAAFNKQF